MEKSKPVRILKIILTVILVLIIAVGGAVGIFLLLYTPTLNVNMSVKTGAVTSGASGYLYGLAEDGVPSYAMCESIDISSVSQKAMDGLQHPIGDVDNVSGMLENTEYNVVYIQDAYDTWYYLHDEIMEMRKNKTYDWQELLDTDFLPKVKETVRKLSETSYGEKVVYCLYNECDNGVWFGETVFNEDGSCWAAYNQAEMDNFNSAWKQAYEAARSVNPDCLIGGPGFCDYYHDEIEYFLSFCVENNCVPDIMIYHELSDDSVYYWDNHVEDYRQTEKDLGIEELPVIVTEYGRMQDNGYPGKMIQYITNIEDTKVYGNNAYWRLSNNLNDVCADDNSPNSNWWLMRWYADMEGQTLETSYHDLFKSDFERSVKNKKHLDSQGFMGIASINDEETKIDIICGGRSGEAKVVLDNINDTALAGKKLVVTVEETVYKGLYGVVNAPVVLKNYTVDAKNKLTINLNDLDEANAYHITVEEYKADDTLSYGNENRPVRYEFEHGTLLGKAYTYDSYCPTSGDINGMVGGMENAGDGVEITVNAKESGTYRLDFVYGNSNDGPYDENGKQIPDGRTFTSVKLLINGEEHQIELANTIKSEYTSCYTMLYELEKGKNTISLSHIKGTYVLDSLVVSVAQPAVAEVLPDSDRTDNDTVSYLVVAPFDGWYAVKSSALSAEILVDGAKALLNRDGEATVYFRRGLNYIDIETSEKNVSVSVSPAEEDSLVLEPDSAVLDGAEIKTNDYGVSYIDGISCNGGKALYTVNAEKAGDYRITVLYSNNDEGGVHDYNVDLIERYITVEIGSETQNIYCRNTYSWDTFKTVTFNVTLEKGENTITFSNNGEEKFNNNDTFAPYISTVTVNPVQK